MNDRYWTSARKSDSEVTCIERPFVALLGASTPAWLNAHLTEADLLGGLHARFLYFFSSGGVESNRYIPFPPAADQRRKWQLIDRGKAIHSCVGTIGLASIRTEYDRWYLHHKAELSALKDRERLGAFWGRLETYCLKLASLYQLSVDVDASTVSPLGSQETDNATRQID